MDSLSSNVFAQIGAKKFTKNLVFGTYRHSLFYNTVICHKELQQSNGPDKDTVDRLGHR